MRVLYIYSLILKRMRGKAVACVGQISEYLPQLWEHAGDHFLLRGAIVCSLLELTLSLASQATKLYQILLPVCATAVDPHSQAYLYLADDGFELWVHRKLFFFRISLSIDGLSYRLNQNSFLHKYNLAKRVHSALLLIY